MSAAPTTESFDLGYEDREPHRRPDGVSLYYEEDGDGPPLCIVNNTYVAAPLWRAFTQKLATRTRVIRYDLRNQGASSPVEKLTYADHVDDLLSLLDALGVERTYLVGSSTSTLICRDFALAHPSRVAGMVLVGPIFNPNGGHRRRALTRSWLRSLELGGPAALFDHIYPLVFGEHLIENGGRAAYLALRERFLALNSPAQLAVNLSASLTTEDDPAALGRIACPTLLIAGDNDFLLSPTSLEAMRRLIPDAVAEIVPFAGHVAYFEATARFEELVQAFVDRVEEA
jgi:3-oxoadipate enol-lactonase